MKQIYSAFLIFAIVLVANSAQALLVSNIEEAILEQDFHKVSILAKEMLTDELASADQERVEYFLGLAHLRSNEPKEAMALFKKLAKRAEDTALRERAYLGLFEIYYNDGQHKRALQVVNKLLKKSKNSELRSLFYLKAARVHLKLSEWAKARKYLEKIIDDYPESLELNIAQQLLEEDQYFTVQVGAFLEKDRAIKVMEDLLRKDQYAYIVQTRDENKTFYRVRVGQITQLKQAQTLKSRLSRLGYPTRIFP